MKRHLLIIAICLLLGAVVNVAVAWGCAAFSDRPEGLGVPESWQVDSWHCDSPTREGSTWHVSTAELPGAYRVTAWSVPPRRPGDWLVTHPRRATRLVSDPADELPDWVQSVVSNEIGGPERSNGLIVIDARGLPLRALYFVGYAPEQVISGGLPVPGWRGESLFRSASALPYRLVWPGFAVNTLFYAAILWLLIASCLALRRFLRLRRGLCPKCAYPMGESAVCTECGGALTNRSR